MAEMALVCSAYGVESARVLMWVELGRRGDGDAEFLGWGGNGDGVEVFG